MRQKGSILTPASRKSLRAGLGWALIAYSVIAPAFPIGVLGAHPWTPLAALWAAYGWASQGEPGWAAPAALAGVGLVHDVMAGGPLGLFALLYVLAFLIARAAGGSMRSPNVVSLWAGFIATAAGVWAAAWFVAPWAIAGKAAMSPLAESLLVTALLFPLARPLYMDVSTV
jgi:rod shape-determining protein MreD